MVDVDDSYNLIYKYDKEHNIIFDSKLLMKLKMNDLSDLPENTSLNVEGIEFFILEFNDKKKVKIFTNPVLCKIKDLDDKIKIFSFDHLKIILQRKIKEKVYSNPYYYSNSSGENVYININEIEQTEIYIDNYIEIKEKEIKDFKQNIESLFNRLKTVYQEKNLNKISFQFISPNFNSYYPNLKVNLTDKFWFIFATNRNNLKSKIVKFLANDNPSLLYPICGPHGTGKTISVLLFHKLLFQKGTRGLYLNVKYFLKDDISFEEKIDVLIKECFFICDSNEELLILYNALITKKNINDLFSTIYDFIEAKNKINIDNNEKEEKIKIDNNNKEKHLIGKNNENIEIANNKENIEIDNNNKEKFENGKNKGKLEVDKNTNNNEINTINKEIIKIDNNNNKENIKIESDKKKIEINKNKKNLEINKNTGDTEIENNIENIKNDNNNKENIDIDNNKENKDNTKKEQFIGKKEIIINKEKYNKIYIILDQYQKKYNENNLFDIFANMKILLLSSINDFDVKENLIMKYENELIEELKIKNQENKLEEKAEKKIIKYHYIDNLINENYYDEDGFKELIKDKIKKKNEDKDKDKEKNEIDKEFESLYKIMKYFDFIPKYFFEYLYYYDSIYDILFYEYSNIMKKLDYFLHYKNIDIKIIENLITKKYLVQKNDANVKTLNKKDFINNIKYIPLKYINYKECDNNEFYFYYSFTGFAEMIREFIDVQKNKDLFFSSHCGSDRGTKFESLVEYKIRVYKRFNIDGFFQVNTLINMDPTTNYINFNKEYITSKNRIFIDQKNKLGEGYDFAIYLPKQCQLLLFQAKYLINYSNVKYSKSVHEKSAKILLQKFNLLMNSQVSEVFLLYISSIFYNYDNRKDAINVLTKKRINCIFYSYITDSFYFNFRDRVTDFNLTNSLLLIPDSGYYEAQEALDNQDFENEEGIYFKDNNEDLKDKKNNEDKTEGEEKKKEKKKDILTEKREREREFEELLFLEKKTIRNKDELKVIYDEIIVYIKNNVRRYNKSIIDLLGPIKSIDSYTKTKINLNTEYALIFYLNESDKNTKIDYDKDIGLIIYDYGTFYCLDVKENKNYYTYTNLIKKFKIDFVYAIGTKNRF